MACGVRLELKLEFKDASNNLFYGLNGLRGPSGIETNKDQQ